MAKWIMMIGAAFVVLGALLHFYPNALNWFGKLPGDIRYESDRSKVFIPITSMIIISLVLTLVLNLLKR